MTASATASNRSTMPKHMNAASTRSDYSKGAYERLTVANSRELLLSSSMDMRFSDSALIFWLRPPLLPLRVFLGAGDRGSVPSDSAW